MAKIKDGCVKPAGGPLVPGAEPTASSEAEAPSPTRKETGMLASVGKEAIDFEATAYIEGVGFAPVKLSDHRGKWIVLCFYLGDFTFV